MNRTDRLYALVEELRAVAPRPLSATRLAERFEVSVRTIERDIAALQQSGVPIWAERGRTGGYAIDARATLPPLNLEADEALAVMLALAAAPSAPFAHAGRRARQKLLAAMRPDQVAAAEQLAQRLRLRPPEPHDATVLRAVEAALRDRRVVTLTYTDGHDRRTERTVEVHGLHVHADATYLVGWCRLRDDGRVFRLDRIETIELTDEVAPHRDLDEVLDVPFDTIAP
ncbi:helix-turn-helix transcriptional regulator [Actinomarinicola tropica]|uniref:WYL domain-containing protein n=1 Tax=Actinomarinicola tropica TaxID=2789776 RepID=A0A5Q2RKC2_9ACTN|nr:WYL domain-containing protein [Actinomarinicola tropica]QGG94310.1 WYL domain-containing protein [Actinomarinicola tropica]